MQTTTPQASNKQRNTTRILTKGGVAVQEHYLREALAMLMRYGTLRISGLAFSLFPNRSQKAARAAAHLVASNACKLEFVDFEVEKKSQYRYYALTAKGAAYLRTLGYESAKPTIALLKGKLIKANHREWTNMCAIAGTRRGIEAYAENNVWDQPFSEDLINHFGHVPDALTFAPDLYNSAAVVWHEFELSRRSSKAPNAPPKLDKDGKPKKDKSGVHQFRSLLTTLRTKRVLLNRGEPYTIKLFLHCASAYIQKEMVRHINAYTLTHGLKLSGGVNGIYSIPFDARGAGQMDIVLNVLPKDGQVEHIWHDGDYLPVPGLDAELDKDYNEQFVKTRARRSSDVCGDHE